MAAGEVTATGTVRRDAIGESVATVVLRIGGVEIMRARKAFATSYDATVWAREHAESMLESWSA